MNLYDFSTTDTNPLTYIILWNVLHLAIVIYEKYHFFLSFDCHGHNQDIRKKERAHFFAGLNSATKNPNFSET